jgi:hypothetical protein
MDLSASLLQPPPEIVGIPASTTFVESYTGGTSYVCHIHLHPRLSALRMKQRKASVHKPQTQSRNIQRKIALQTQNDIKMPCSVKKR